MVWQLLNEYLVDFLVLASSFVPSLRDSQITSNHSSIDLNVRIHWMREAALAVQLANKSPCPFEAFGAVVVNHTGLSELGDLICTGANAISHRGNPTLHGEIAAINNCTNILTDPHGLYKFDATEAAQAWKSLSLYTTAEPCPMCSAAIRWGGFKECIFATSTEGLTAHGWPQIDISAAYLFSHSKRLGTDTVLIGNVLNNETDSLFAWQFDPSGTCPEGCHRSDSETTCRPK